MKSQKNLLSFQAGINGEVSEVAKYSEAKWEKVHLNFNQTKV